MKVGKGTTDLSLEGFRAVKANLYWPHFYSKGEPCRCRRMAHTRLGCVFPAHANGAAVGARYHTNPWRRRPGDTKDDGDRPCRSASPAAQRQVAHADVAGNARQSRGCRTRSEGGPGRRMTSSRRPDNLKRNLKPSAEVNHSVSGCKE